MALYETIFTRRQVRNYLNSPVPKDRFDHIIIYSASATTRPLHTPMSVLYCKRLTCVSRAWNWAVAGL